MDTIQICPSCGKPLATNAPKGLCPECLLKAGFPTGSQADPGNAGHAKHANFAPPKPEELAPHFPQLEILELVGQGGMGVVYKARQKQLDRLVALKILPPNVSDDPAFADRFAREAKALAKLNHPNIVTLYEFGRTDGLFYFLMEFMDGVNLRQLLNVGRIAPREALAIVPQICDALQYAHDKGIVHRDIKPENILLDRAGRVKVADFGLAKLVGTEALTRSLSHPMGEGAAPAAGEGMSLPSTTEAGHVLGTPQYMAPEQVKHPQEVDHRADIYSLGVVFYQMLTGELPGKPIVPPSSRTPGIQIDVRLDEVVLRALEKKPELRYQQASVLKTEVETIESGEASGRTEATASPDDLASSRSCICYVSSPEHLRSFYGSCIYVYEGKGTIHLSAEELAFSDPKSPIHIPLCSIRDLHIGHYSRLAKPMRLDYISVTYEEAGNTRTRLFTPSWSGLTPTWITNRLVADWFNAIQAAVRKIQGATIAPTPQGTAGVPPVAEVVEGRAERELKRGGIVLVGRRNGQRVIVWRGVANTFFAILGCVLIPILVFQFFVPIGAEGLIVAILFASLLTAAGVIMGIRTPVDQLTRLDDSPSGSSRREEAHCDKSEMTPRFSRWVIMGLALALLIFMVLSLKFAFTRQGTWGPFNIFLVFGIGFIILSSWRTAYRALKGGPAPPAKHRILSVIWIAILLLNLFLWWNRYEPAGVWIPDALDASVSGEYGEALIHVTDVSQNGQVVLVKLVCDTPYPERGLYVEYSGQIFDYPAYVVSSVTNVDCLVSPRFNSGQDKVLAGTALLKGKPVYRIGFVLPDAATAAKVVEQVKQVHLGKPRGLDQNKCVLELFQLHRRVGEKTSGQPVSEHLTAMLIWQPKQTSNANSKPAAAQNLSFGPVIERFIQARATGTNLFLDFDTGRLLTPPAEVTSALEDRDSQTEMQSWHGLNIPKDSNRYRYILWLRESGADLMYIGGGQLGGQLIGFDGVFALAHGGSSTNWGDWNVLTPEQVHTAVAVVDSSRRASEASRHGLPPLFAPILGGIYNSAIQFHSREPDGPIINLLTRDQSMTWFFKTREGASGLMQITGFTDNPPGVKIRYKLVQNGSAAKVTPVITPEQLAEPPVLRFLAWQDEWRTNQPGAARHPDGSPVTNATELGWLRAVPPLKDAVLPDKVIASERETDKSSHRALHLWFSHPQFDRDSLNEIAILDDQGRSIQNGRIAAGCRIANEYNGNLGWALHTVRLNPLTHVNVRFYYTIGPLERTLEILPNYDAVFSPENGGYTITGLGQNADGKAFVSIAVDAAKMPSRVVGVIAVTPDGRELHCWTWHPPEIGSTSMAAEKFEFDIPLSAVAKFIIGTRPIRTMEWKDVVLPEN